MEETIVDSQKSREYLEALKGAWNEILDSISAQDRALLLGSEPVLANSKMLFWLLMQLLMLSKL